MRVGGQRQTPAALPPGKIRYPLYRRLGGPQSRFGQVRKISPPTRIRFPDSPARSESLYRLRSHGSRKAPVLLSLLLPWLLKLLLPNLPWLPWSSVSCDYLCCHDYIGCHNYLYHQVSHCSYGYCGYLVYQCSLLSMVMRTRQKLFAISCPF